METEKAFLELLEKPLREAEKIGYADIVVGIPFTNETDAVGHVCLTAANGLHEFYPDRKCILICAGSSCGEVAIHAIQELRLPKNVEVITFLSDLGTGNGEFRNIRAILEITDRLSAELVLLEAGLTGREYTPQKVDFVTDWIRLLLLPVEKEGMDLVVPSFTRNDYYIGASDHLVCPLISSMFNLRLISLPGLLYGISSRLVRALRNDPIIWGGKHNGFDPSISLLISALTNEMKYCQIDLGKRNAEACTEDESLWKKQVNTIFEQISANSEWWQQQGDITYTMAFIGEKNHIRPRVTLPDPNMFVNRFQHGFNEFKGFYEELLPRDALFEIRRLAGSGNEDIYFDPSLWGDIVFEFLIAYGLEHESKKENIIHALMPLLNGRLAGYINGLNGYHEKVKTSMPEEADHLTSLVAEYEMEVLHKEFVRRRIAVRERWIETEKALQPLLPEVTYREFIPGYPLLALKEISSPSGDTIDTESIYKSIFQKYHDEFVRFLIEVLDTSMESTSDDITARLRQLMLEAEQGLDRLLLSGGLTTINGARGVVNTVFEYFPHSTTFALRPEVTTWILQRNPPQNLIINLNIPDLTELLDQYSANDVLAMAFLLEDPEFSLRVYDWIAANPRPENFTVSSIEPIVVNYSDFPVFAQLKEPCQLFALAGRIAISNLPEENGDLPRLFYLLKIAKNVVEAETFGGIWQQFAKERKEFGTRVVNSLKGHWGREPLSAHNMFENKIQRELINRIGKMLTALADKGSKSDRIIIENYKDLMRCYHLAFTHPDGTFLPCSAWTWSEYSYKGGKGLPTPLSLHVERDWTSREFMTEILNAIGYSEEYMDKQIIELMGQGRESDNLARLILPGWEKVEDVTQELAPRLGEPEAGVLRRFEDNPILRPITDHYWESRYVFNPGIIRLRNKIYILYRASGNDEVSHIGLAISSDGFHIDERLENPIFGPKQNWEKRGCEDPRLVLIEGCIYMLYTAYDGVTAQIAMASIELEDFLEHRWDKWKRHGLVFPGFENKDATLFPERFGGKYIMFHRIEPSIWITSSESLDVPWPREDHQILAGPGAGTAWDGFKIGGGSQPIKTKYGWLLIYHGVDHKWIYRLGVLLVSLEDPSCLLYRSPNHILSPEESCELGEEGCYVPNVVFTCGAVSLEEKDILEDDDSILVYYGAADTTICVATAKISELIPETIRRNNKRRSLFSDC